MMLHCSKTIARRTKQSFTRKREHRLLSSETSIWQRLTAPNAVNYHMIHPTRIYSAVDIRMRVDSCHELLGQLYLTLECGFLRILSQLNLRSLSNSKTKTPCCTHSSAIVMPTFFWLFFVLFELNLCREVS